MISPDDTCWLLPTRRRPPRLAACLAAHLTCATRSRGLILVDRADWRALRHLYLLYPLPSTWEFVETDGESMGDKVREAWPRYRDAGAVGLLGDDNIPVTPNWDAKLGESLTGWNVVSSDDGWQAPKRMAGGTLWSGDLLRAIGYLYPPELQHCYVDDVWEELGREADCWTVRMDVLVRHDHASKLHTEDETHRLAYGQMMADRVRFEEWRRAEKPRCLEVIRRGPPRP